MDLIKGPNAPGVLRMGVYGGGTGLMRYKENTLPSGDHKQWSHAVRNEKQRHGKLEMAV